MSHCERDLRSELEAARTRSRRSGHARKVYEQVKSQLADVHALQARHHQRAQAFAFLLSASKLTLPRAGLHRKHLNELDNPSASREEKGAAAANGSFLSLRPASFPNESQSRFGQRTTSPSTNFIRHVWRKRMLVATSKTARNTARTPISRRRETGSTRLTSAYDEPRLDLRNRRRRRTTRQTLFVSLCVRALCWSFANSDLLQLDNTISRSPRRRSTMLKKSWIT